MYIYSIVPKSTVVNQKGKSTQTDRMPECVRATLLNAESRDKVQTPYFYNIGSMTDRK